MEAKELRIGNLVNFDDRDYYLVSGISQEFSDSPYDLELQTAFGTYICDVPIEDIKGVTITEEWLLNFGYRYYTGKTSGDLTKDFNGKLDIDFIDGQIKVKSHYEGKDMYRELHNIKYVHQLQNLYFALTGEELEITNATKLQ